MCYLRRNSSRRGEPFSSDSNEHMQCFWSIHRDKMSLRIGDCSLMTGGQWIRRISSSLTLESKIKEIEMLIHPVSKIFVTLAILATALVTISFANRSASPVMVQPGTVHLSDFYERHPRSEE